MKYTYLSIFAFLFFFACTKTSTINYDCSAITPTYTNDIKAIMDANCATSGCHNATSKAKGIDLSTYALVKSESANAKFLGSIEHKSGYNAMPQGAAKLADAHIQKIACWIEQGAAE